MAFLHFGAPFRSIIIPDASERDLGDLSNVKDAILTERLPSASVMLRNARLNEFLQIFCVFTHIRKTFIIVGFGETKEADLGFSLPFLLLLPLLTNNKRFATSPP